MFTQDDVTFLLDCGIVPASLPKTAVIRENDYSNFELVVNGNIKAVCTHPNPLYALAKSEGLEPVSAF